MVPKEPKAGKFASFNFKIDNLSSLLNTCFPGSLILVFKFFIIDYLKKLYVCTN